MRFAHGGVYVSCRRFGILVGVCGAGDPACTHVYVKQCGDNFLCGVLYGVLDDGEGNCNNDWKYRPYISFHDGSVEGGVGTGSALEATM